MALVRVVLLVVHIAGDPDPVLPEERIRQVAEGLPAILLEVRIVFREVQEQQGPLQAVLAIFAEPWEIPDAPHGITE